MKNRLIILLLTAGSTTIGGCTAGDPTQGSGLAVARQAMNGTVVFPDDSCSEDEQNRIQQGFDLAESHLASDAYSACVNEAFFASTPDAFPEYMLRTLRTDVPTKIYCAPGGGTGWWPGNGDDSYGNEYIAYSKQWLTPPDAPPCGKEGIGALALHEIGHAYYFVHKGDAYDIEYDHSAPVYFDACSWLLNSSSRPYVEPGRSFLTHETTLATVGFYGGEPFDLSCSMDAMLNGLDVTWDGVHITSLSTSCQSPWGTPGWHNGVFGPTGSAEGTPYALRCAQDEVAVGLTGAIGATPDYLRQVDVLCVQRDVWKDLPPSTEFEANKSLTHAAGAIGVAPGDSYVWSRLCPPGMAIKSVRGRSGTRIDQLEISCQRIDRDVDVKLTWLPVAGAPAAETVHNLELCSGHAAMTGLIVARTPLTDKGPDDPLGVVTRLGGWCETVSWDASEHLSPIEGERQLVEPQGDWTNWKSEDACPSGQALVGLNLWADEVSLHAIQGLCAPISDWADPSIPYVQPTPTPKRGGSIGVAVQRKCARSEFLFGWMLDSGSAVQQIAPICRRLTLVPPGYAPTGLASALAPGQVVLSWNAVPEASRYIVQRSLTSPSGPFTTLQTDLTGPSYADTDVEPNTTYYYKVAGANSAGVGPDSTVLTVDSGAMPSVLPSDVPTNVALAPQETVTLYADNWPSKDNPYWTANVVLSVNSISGWVIPPATAVVNGVSYPFGGNYQYYEVIDIPDEGPYTIAITSTSAVTLQVQLGNR
ncbi:MAG: fibronectin type III domain-containing protein [Polyangiaceae bacterium]|nr:fibronectin type III domain-containing protein [Polyangiaceae bacterium]